MLSVYSRSEVQRVKDPGLVARVSCPLNRHAISITIEGEREGKLLAVILLSIVLKRL